MQNEVVQKPQCLFSDFKFWPKVRTVDEVIKEAELKLITIDDYSDNQFQLRTKKEVKEDLDHFHRDGFDVLTNVHLISFLSE
jgi:ABC-type Zn2+ transport system substrate-binding protein/surface adhesin